MYEINWTKFISKVNIYLSNNTVVPFEGNGDIISASIKASLSDTNKEPLGLISCNTFNFKLMDRDNKFVTTNTESEYYGLFDEGTKVEYFVTVDGTIKKKGVYYITDIKNSTGTNNISTVEFSCADRLMYILSRPLPKLAAHRNISVSAFIKELFAAEGIVPIVDSNLNNIKIAYGFLVGNTYKDTLNMICQSFNIVIYCDDNGEVNVKLLSTLKNNELVYEFNGVTGTLFKTTNNVDLKNSYNACKLDYIKPSIVKSNKLLSVNNISCIPGNSWTDEYSYNGMKALALDYVIVTSEDDTCTLNSVSSDQGNIKIAITNRTDSNKDCSVDVYGRAIIENKASMTQIVAGADVSKIKYKTVNSEYIQNSSHARSLMTSVLTMLSSKMSYITVSAKGHPHLSIGDRVRVVSDLLSIDAEFIVNELNLSFGSSYTFNANLLYIPAIA